MALCKQHTGSTTELVWASEVFLREQEIYSMWGMPLWAPLSEDAGFMQISNQKALANGLRIRSVEETFTDVLQWVAAENPDYQFGEENDDHPGLSEAMHLRLLEEY